MQMVQAMMMVLAGALVIAARAQEAHPFADSEISRIQEERIASAVDGASQNFGDCFMWFNRCADDFENFSWDMEIF